MFIQLETMDDGLVIYNADLFVNISPLGDGSIIKFRGGFTLGVNHTLAELAAALDAGIVNTAQVLSSRL